MGNLRAWIRRQRSADPRGFRVRAVLAALLFGLLVYLVAGHNPWHDGIARRLRDGDPVRPLDFARTWGWWAAAGNALLVAGLLASSRRWLRDVPAPACARLAPPPAPGRLAAAGLLAAAVVAAAVLSYPRLSFSWWDDEEYTVRHHVDGHYVGKGEGPPGFHRVLWRDTFWDDREANNHVAFSVLSRLSLAAWRAVARPEARFASEAAVRLPAWLAGLGGVAVTGLLGWRLGFAWAGVFAAWLLALHPWYLRYASEARGYAFVLLLLPAIWLLALRAMERGSWGRWAAYAAAECVLLWTHVGMLYALVLTNLGVLAGIALYHRGALREQLTRFGVATLVATGVWAQLMLANLFQVMEYLAGWQKQAAVAPLDEVASYLLLGVELKTRDPVYVTLATVAAAHPLLLPTAAGLALAAGVLGCARLLWARGMAALLVPALLLPGPLLYAMSWLRHDRLYPWYVVFVLPGYALLIGVGTWSAAAWLPRRRLAFGAAGLLLVAQLAVFGAATRDARDAMRAGSIVPTRESVLLTRPERDPLAPANRAILTASFSQPPAYYDPLVRWVTSPGDLRALMAEADRRGVPLFVNNGRPHSARKEQPELQQLVAESGLFEEVAVLPGLEKRGKRVIYRYVGRGAGGSGTP